jgi:polysaccharide export outer membrane protein
MKKPTNMERTMNESMNTPAFAMPKNIFFALLLVLAQLFALAAPLPVRADNYVYVIGEGDTLMVTVWGEKDLSLTVKVRPDGKITLPALGEITAANTTPNALQTELTSRLKGIVKNPVVTVIVMEVTNNKVYVFGGGVSSGVFSLTQRTTLLQLLCQIGQENQVVVEVKGGTANSSSAQSADLRNAYVIRKGKKVKQDFYDLFMKGDLSQDFEIAPNDAIFIPAFRDRNVYVMGAVTAPKSITYRDGLTVVEAILEAGGFTKFAKQNDTVIYRKDGEKDVAIPVKVKNLINDGDLRQNTRLLPGDYVVVNESLF